MRVADHAYVIRDGDWKPVRIIGRSAEVADANDFEAEGYREVFENSPRATLLVDREMRIVEANDAAADLLGYRTADLVKVRVDTIFPESRRIAAMKKLLALGLDPTVRFEEDCRRADGEIIRAQVDASLIAVKGTSIDHILTLEELSDTDVGQ